MGRNFRITDNSTGRYHTFHIFCISDNSTGRCHIFHQLIAICKDMAETIVMLDKALKTARHKFQEEDKDVYIELFDTETFLETAGNIIFGIIQTHWQLSNL